MNKESKLKYRNFLWCSSFGKLVVLTVSKEDNEKSPRDRWEGFCQWLGGWKHCTITPEQEKKAEETRNQTARSVKRYIASLETR